MDNFDNNIIFIHHDGFLSQETILTMTNILEKDIEKSNLNIGLVVNIVTVFIEMSQNILNYSKNDKKNCREIESSGLILVSKDEENNYYIQSQNIVSIDDNIKMDLKLKEINTLDKEEIRIKYRELRKSGKNTHEKGGGIGFYEIARRCNDLKYKFLKLNEDKFVFHLNVKINAKKNI